MGGVNISPNTSGLPGISEAVNIVGSLLTFCFIAAVAGVAISGVVTALGHHWGNTQWAQSGKTGIVASLGAAMLAGGAGTLVHFFAGAGGAL
jgi:hypothetical protein